VTERQARAHLNNVFDDAFDPATAAWDLQPDGSWERTGDPQRDFQELIMKRLADRGE
jgi:hypothetical protein